MQRIHGLQLVVVLGAAFTLASTAAAQTPASAPAPSAKAEDLFHEALRLVAQQQWPEAEQKFLAAWALNPSYDVAANLGQTEYRLGKHRDAAEHLAYAIRNWPLVGKREPRERAEKRLVEVRTLVASLKVHVNVAGATVLVDGTPVGRSPLDAEVFVDAGTHTVEAKLDGYADARAQVTVEKGATAAPALALERPAPAPPPTGTGSAAPPPVPGARRSVVPGAVMGGAAGVAVAVGVGLIVVGAQKRTSAETMAMSILAAHHSCVAKPRTSTPGAPGEEHDDDLGHAARRRRGNADRGGWARGRRRRLLPLADAAPPAGHRLVGVPGGWAHGRCTDDGRELRGYDDANERANGCRARAPRCSKRAVCGLRNGLRRRLPAADEPRAGGCRARRRVRVLGRSDHGPRDRDRRVRRLRERERGAREATGSRRRRSRPSPRPPRRSRRACSRARGCTPRRRR